MRPRGEKSRPNPTWYQRNKDRVMAQKKKWKESKPEFVKDVTRRAGKKLYDKKRAIVNAYKNKPCVDCDTHFHVCQMDLDHIRGIKKFNIGQSVKGISFEKLVDELEKCEVVCSNCHRIRTWNRLHGILTSES